MTFTTLTLQAMLGFPSAIVHRMCGETRTEGSIYIESGISLSGQDIRSFLIDPPEPFEAADHGVSAVAPRIIPQGPVYHLIDWVGESYPMPADFIEEAAFAGVSRKISPTFDFSLLSTRSRIILFHPKAVLTNPGDFQGLLPDFRCPNDEHDHTENCSGHHYTALPPRARRGEKLLPGVSTRALGEGSYPVAPLPEGMPEPEYRGGLFMQVPITRITFTYDASGRVPERNQRAWTTLSANGVPVAAEFC